MAVEDDRDREPGIVAGIRLAWRTLLFGISRPFVTLLATIGFAAAAVGIGALMAPDYAPRYVLRVTEVDRDPNTMPRPKRELREYVLTAVFTSEPLFEVMRKHDLYPALMRGDPRGALTSFKEDIEVEVYRNYFVEERSPTELPRSARVAVRYRAKNPEIALAVTRDLGALIVERERKVMHDQAARAAGVAIKSVDRLKRELLEKRRNLAQKQHAIRADQNFDPQREVELVSLWGSVDSLERELSTAERRKAALNLGAELERSGVGLRFEVVDDGALPESGRFDVQDLFSLGGLALVLGLPLVALAVGAFSSKRGMA